MSYFLSKHSVYYLSISCNPKQITNPLIAWFLSESPNVYMELDLFKDQDIIITIPNTVQYDILKYAIILLSLSLHIYLLFCIYKHITISYLFICWFIHNCTYNIVHTIRHLSYLQFKNKFIPFFRHYKELQILHLKWSANYVYYHSCK